MTSSDVNPPVQTIAIREVLEAAKSTGIKEIYVWILNHLSKCLIRQAEQEVAAKQDSAFPLAQVVSWLLLGGHEELGNVLMSRLVKKCCWCVGFVPAREPVSMVHFSDRQRCGSDLTRLLWQAQDDASYAKQLGRKSPDEATGAFTSRLCGIFAFYAAILQVEPTQSPGEVSQTIALERIPSHFRNVAMWKWTTRALLSPVINQNIAPSLWSTFLEVAGAAFQQAYGRQASKVFFLLLEDGIKGKKAKWVASADCESSTIRLSLVLEQWQKEGRIQQARGARMEA